MKKFINQKKSEQKKKSLKTYEQGVLDGHKKATTEYREKLKQLALNGMYEKELPILRSEFRELAGKRIGEQHRSEFLDFCDKRAFKAGVSKPRAKLRCYYLDGFFDYAHTGIFIDCEDYTDVYDKEMAIESNAIYLLFDYLRRKFIVT